MVITNIVYYGDNMDYLTPLDLIGNTPLVYLKKLSKKYDCNIYLKLEKYNLTGSSKDRAVKEMLLYAINNNLINKDTTIIEPTSGNTGIALSALCAILSLKCIIVMPSNCNIERINIIKTYGAKIVFTNKETKMKGAIKKTKELLRKIKNSYSLSQFENVNNIKAHYNYTSKEIISSLPNLDGFFATYGSGGTISGVSKSLKEYNNNIKVIAIKPCNKQHIIDGISSNIKSKNYYTKYIDETISVEDINAIETIKEVAKLEGIFIGLSSGCAISGTLDYINKNKLKNVVIFCCDGGERYLSNKYLYPSFDYKKSQIEEDVEYIKEIMFKENIDYNDIIWHKYNITSKHVKSIKKELLLDANAILNNDPAANSINEIINVYPGFFAIFTHRIAYYLWNNNLKEYARIISEYAHFKTGIDIHPNAKIGKRFCIDHGNGVVIGETTIIGNDVRIYQGVTLGALSLKNPLKLKNQKRHPTIKNNVIIYASATILGGNTIIGNNVIIGGNTFVTSSIEDNKIVVVENQKCIIKENKKNDI